MTQAESSELARLRADYAALEARVRRLEAPPASPATAEPNRRVGPMAEQLRVRRQVALVALHLMDHAGEWVSNEELAPIVVSWSADGSQAARMCILDLRKALERHGYGDALTSVRRVGHRLDRAVAEQLRARLASR